MNYSTMSDREIDAAVARRLGWKHVDGFAWTDPDGDVWHAIPDYSASIAAAWKLVEQARIKIDPQHDGWLVTGPIHGVLVATFNDIPRAICEAWLAATEKST